MKIFIDTNVVVDYLARREGYSTTAEQVLEMARRGLAKGAVSALTLINCAYIIKKHYDKTTVLDKVFHLANYLEVTPMDLQLLRKAKDENPYDFEDAVQYHSAKAAGADLIITRDEKGFREFPIDVMSPAEFLEACL